MMNKILKYTLFLFLLIGLFSCKEDESSTIYIVPYAEQEPIDNALIIDFLSTNYFNEEEFLNPIVGFDFNLAASFFY